MPEENLTGTYLSDVDVCSGCGAEMQMIGVIKEGGWYAASKVWACPNVGEPWHPAKDREEALTPRIWVTEGIVSLEDDEDA